MRTVLIDVPKVRQAMVDKGIDTVVELSEISDISRWVLYKALSSRRGLTPSSLRKLADTLSMSVETLRR